jgi:hypothetical protein
VMAKGRVALSGPASEVADLTETLLPSTPGEPAPDGDGSVT